jgi:L-lactate dehydrogenase complex protein LldG
MTAVEQLRTRATDSASIVHELASWKDVARLALEIAEGGRISITPSLSAAQPDLVAALHGYLIEPSLEAPFASVADVAVGIVRAVLAIAETGSVLLAQHEPADRAVSMLSRTAIQVVDRDRVVDSLDEVATWLADNSSEVSLATLVTGPSRTADIERSLTIGVQGPANLHLVVLG